MPIPCPHFKITIVKRSQGQTVGKIMKYREKLKL